MNNDPIRGNTKTRTGSPRQRTRPVAMPVEEELETGEPIPEEDELKSAAKKIPGVRGKFDKVPTTQTETSGSFGGQVVLSSAKYLKLPPAPSNGRKAKTNPCDSGSQATDQSLEGRVLNGGVWGGLLAMAVAVIWFMAGLMADVFFVYPPILFVLGLVAFCKAPSREG